MVNIEGILLKLFLMGLSLLSSFKLYALTPVKMQPSKLEVKPEQQISPENYHKMIQKHPFQDISQELVNYQVALGPWGPATGMIMQMQQEYKEFQDTLNKKACGEKDLRDGFQRPPRNQGNFGWCYAYAISDYYSYITGEKASAFDVALNMFNEEIDEGNFDKKLSKAAGYYPDRVLRRIFQTGLCYEDDIQSNDINHTISWKGQEKDIGSPGVLGYTEFLNFLANIPHEKSKRQFYLCESQFNMIKQVFTAAEYGDVLNILTFYEKHEIWDELKKLSCKKKIAPPNHEVIAHTKKNNFDTLNLLDKINEQLDSQSGTKAGKPVIIHYDADLPSEESEVTTDNDYNHASLVVGRRTNPNTGQCEYLIRNSWGTDVKDPNEDKDLVTYDNGYYWAPANALLGNLYSVTYTQKK